MSRCVNECLKVSDESDQGGQQQAEAAAVAPDRGVRLATPPSDKLVTITNNMNTNLTALLAILQVIALQSSLNASHLRLLSVKFLFKFINVCSL